MRRSRPLLLILLTAMCACSTWRAQTAPAPQVIARGGSRLRIVRGDWSVVEMRDARVVGDSIVGEHAGTLRHVAVATADVRRIYAYRVDAVETVTLTVGMLVAGAILFYVAVIAPVFGNPKY